MSGKSFEAIDVKIESIDHGRYTITAINADNEVREFSAGALNLNGYAFATSGMTIGEYGETVTIEKRENSRYVNLSIAEEAQ